MMGAKLKIETLTLRYQFNMLQVSTKAHGIPNLLTYTLQFM